MAYSQISFSSRHHAIVWNSAVKIAYFAALLLAAPWCYAAEPPVRLAGISFSDGGPSWAVIEIEPGKQQLLREGDTTGDVTLVSIAASFVELEIGSETYVLQLAAGNAAVEEFRAITTIEINMDHARETILGLAGESAIDPAAVNAAFGLPENYHIVSVNQEAVGSLRSTVDALVMAFENGEPYKLELTGPQGGYLQEMYLLPLTQEAAQPAEHAVKAR